MRRRALALALPLVLIAETARADPPPPQSPTMRIAGIVLTSVAAAGIVGGSIAVALGTRAATDAGRAAGTTYGSMGIGLGVLGAAVGIPLWVVGSRPAPAVVVGPTAIALQFRF